MVAVAISLASVVVGLGVMVVWLVHGRLSAETKLADARVAQVVVEGELERSQFELKTTRRALRAADARQQILERTMTDVIASDPNPDLARNDYVTRHMRIVAEWARHDSESGLPAGTAPAVPDDGASATTYPAVRTVDDPMPQ